MKGSAGGEIVQVQGGHIVRATGRKDRHSKVYTAKGPRDRRVRLSAHTAIQFYDVQDRLGYDRPSKAVDWLIKKAKSAIDELAELPPWHPMEADENAAAAAGPGAAEMVITEQSESSGYSPFMAQNLDPDAIPDTMKSLFPISSSTASSMNFQSYPSSGLISRTGNTDQDLGLSLHSFQDQDFSGSGPVGYEGSFQTMMAHDENRGGGFSINPPPLPLLGQDTEFSQRGTLQSSFVSSIRAWNDLAMDDSSSAAADHRTHEIHQSFLFGSRFAADRLMPGFGIPARIHGEEEQSAVSDRPNSSSSPHSQN